MAIRSNDDRHIVEFQFRGKRVHQRLPPGATREDATELEARLRRKLFGQIDLARPVDETHPLLANPTEHDQWLLIANLLLSATDIRPRPGVYFLCRAGKLIYIGQSKNVASRLAGHNGKDYDRAVMIELPVSELSQTERYLIKMLHPELNGRWVGT